MIVKIKYSELEMNQPLQILGLAGSVACGKSTLTKLLTKVVTQRHSSEKINNASIKLGYTNLRIFKKDNDIICNPVDEKKLFSEGYKLIKSLSISDAPGHNSYFSSMLSGSKFMNLCLFLICGINGIEPQTYQHIKVVKSMVNNSLNNIAMVITKCDQIKNDLAFADIYDKTIDLLDEYLPLDDFAINIPIIPISNIDNINIDAVLDYVISVPYPDLNLTINERTNMTIIRSFDVNKPGTQISELVGATVGGVLTKGNMTINDVICIVPGIKLEYNVYKPLITTIKTLKSDKNNLSIAVPGGFIALSTTLDPYLSKDDNLIGQVIIGIDKENDLYDIKLSNKIILDRVIYYLDITFVKNDIVLLMYHGATIMAEITNIVNDSIELLLKTHIYGNIDDDIMILKNNINTLNFCANGKVKTIVYESENCPELYFDRKELEEFNFTTIKSKFECINDLETNNEYKDREYETLIKKFNTKKKNYSVRANFENPIINKDNVKFTIVNALNMISAFFPQDNEINSDPSKNYKLMLKILDKFAVIIKNKYDATSYSILNSSIIITGVKKVKKRINTDGIMSCLHTLINENFICNNCSEFASIYIDVNLKICRNCKASTHLIKL